MSPSKTQRWPLRWSRARKRHAERANMAGMVTAAIGVVAIGTALALSGKGELWWSVPAFLVVAWISVKARGTAGVADAIEAHRQVLRDHGEVPPPADVEDPGMAAEEVTHLRRVAIVVTAVAIVGAGYCGFRIVQSDRVSDTLAARGQATTATVLDEIHRRRAPDRLEIEFDVDGQRVVTETVDVERDLSEGSTLDIVFDPQEPPVARPSMDVSGGTWHWWIYGLSAPLAIAAAWGRYHRTRRGRPVAEQPEE